RANHMIISQIAAMTRNRVIGKDNRLPWRLPADMAFFKSTTTGHHVIMGRKNYEAEKKPLPSRTNIVVTSKADYKAEGCIVVHSIKEGIEIARKDGEKECFIIGGGEIYQESLEMTDQIYLTIIDTEMDGDVFFPEINFDNWKIVRQNEYAKDENNPFDFTIYLFKRIRE
ncbi:MAG TPA: dihydrofolate reductase, partial [Bacteroidales bacterium]|nr:dihydrofolate reductase [Bacteroidales bacterium]